jgi:NAD+ diphosphatase
VAVALDRLALSRSTLDRAAYRRARNGLVDDLLSDPATAVLVLDVDRAPAAAAGTAGSDPELVLLDPVTALAFVAAAWPGPGAVLPCYLGDDRDGRSHIVLAHPQPPRKGLGRGVLPEREEPDPPAGTRWVGLREVGALLGDTDTGLLTSAVALSYWHAGHPRCSRCGEPTDVVQAGWARVCPACTAEHYPRTDGAVIMLIADDEDRILLGRQTGWPERRYSCLAGFVEPGESLEAAVRREVAEETGVLVGKVTYLGSQPWPFPASLMVGFRGRALSTEVTVDGDELAEAGWWSRERFTRDVAGGDLRLPPAVSIARRLIEDWYGAPIDDVQNRP